MVGRRLEELLAAFGEDLEATVIRNHRASPGSATNLPCDLCPITTHSEPQLLHLKIRLDQTIENFKRHLEPQSHPEVSLGKHLEM
jgi:hypothetical protein